MPYPRQIEIEIPLLEALVELGGEAKPRDVYPLVTKRFPQITAEELEARFENYPSTRKWSNLIQWVRQRLIDQKQVDGSQRGVWRISAAGRDRLAALKTVSPSDNKTVHAAQVSQAPLLSLRDLVNQNSEEIKARLLVELRGLSPRAFEHFCKDFLVHLGYRNVEVTKRSQDGGLDGHGDFRQGAISIRSAFQAKRWTDTTVGTVEIDKFRGAIQGDFDHGVFITTSKFSSGAKQLSHKKGAITVLLLDGVAVTDLLVERGIGIRKIPIHIYDIDDEFFDFEEE